MNLITTNPNQTDQSSITMALIASEVRLQNEMDKAALVQRKYQQEALETMQALGKENAQLKTSLIGSESSKKELESLNNAKEKAFLDEIKLLKEEISQLKIQNSSLTGQVTTLTHQVVKLNKINDLFRQTYIRGGGGGLLNQIAHIT